MKLFSILVASLLLTLLIASTAVASWPTGAQGSQYGAVNTAMENAVAGVGLSPTTFTNIYNDAVTGNIASYSSGELDAACSVLGSLSSYTDVLSDYDAVYGNLGCGNRLTGASTRGALPSTGIAIALLIGSGVIGIGAASQLLKRSR